MVTFLILYFSVIIRFGRMAVPLGASWGSELNCRVPPHKVRFGDNIIAQVSLMVLKTHPELTTEHGHPMSLDVSREEMGPGANDAFVANVSVSPSSRTLFCVRVTLGFCKIHFVVHTCTRKPADKMSHQCRI